MNQLPSGWTETTGRELFALVTSGSRGWAKYYADTGPVFVRIGNLDHGTVSLDLADIQHVRPPSGAEGERTRLRAEDILVSITAELGMVALVPKSLGEAYINQHIALIRPLPGSDPRFLAWFLASEADGKKQLNEMRRGATKVGLGLDDIRSVTFPFPPVAEQKRIADKLEWLLARADACRQRLERVPTILKRFRQSVLASATNGELTKEWREECPGADRTISWSESALADLCIEGRVITYGVIKLGNEVRDGVPCLRTSNVRWLRVDVDGVKRIAPKLSAEYGRTVLQGGEVLVNVRGTLGGVAVADESMRGWNVSREVAVVPVDARRVLPKYLALWVGADRSQRWLAGVEKGVTYTGINIEDLRTLPVSLPPLDEQREIVRRVEKLFQLAYRVDLRHRGAVLRLSSMPRAVLAKAFRGELVPQDPNDEPASDLLNRIQVEAASRTKAREPTPIATKGAGTKSAPEARGRRRAAR